MSRQLSEHERLDWQNCGDANRRDNIEDFVDGLVRTEIFPYPDGQRDLVPCTTVPVQEVKLKPGAYEKLTTWIHLGVWFEDDGVWVYGDEVMKLTPELGVGAFEVVYHARGDGAGSTPPHPPISPPDAKSNIRKSRKSEEETLRSGLWARLDWVFEKMEYVNWLRGEALNPDADWKKADPMWWNDPADDSAQDLKEEADPFDEIDVSSDISADSQNEEAQYQQDSQDINEVQDKFPDAEQLSGLDVTTLKTMFEIKELRELHTSAQDHGSKKRPIVVTEDDLDAKRPRIDHIDTIISNYVAVGTNFPDTESDGARIRAFRQAVGKLHMAARILELEHNMSRPAGNQEFRTASNTEDTTETLPVMSALARSVYRYMRDLVDTDEEAAEVEHEIIEMAADLSMPSGDVLKGARELQQLELAIPSTGDEEFWCLVSQ